MLHPPALKSLGMDRKITLGAWSRPAFTTLHRMRRLRGTALDPFGRGKVRRIERALIKEYVATVQRALEVLSADNQSTVVELVTLPDTVRGYEQIKLDNVTRYHARLQELLLDLAPSATTDVTQG